MGINAKPDSPWHTHELGELALQHLDANDRLAAQVYATLALAAEVRALRQHFNDEAQKEPDSLFAPASLRFDYIPDSELPEIPL